MRDRGNGCSLMVRNLSRYATDTDLRVEAEKYGPVRDIYIPKDYHTQQARGIAFIEFTDPRDCEDALDMEGLDICDRKIQVNVAKEQRKSTQDFRRRDRYDDHRGGGGRDRYDDRRGGRDMYDDRRGSGRDRYDDRRRSRSRERFDDRRRNISPAPPRRSPPRHLSPRGPVRDYSPAPRHSPAGHARAPSPYQREDSLDPRDDRPPVREYADHGSRPDDGPRGYEDRRSPSPRRDGIDR